MRYLSRAHVTAFLFYLGVAVLITWPLARDFSTRLVGHPFSDSYEYIRHIWWIKHALQTGQTLFFQPLLAYPDGLPGAWLWSVSLQSFPAWLFAFVMPLPAAFNLSALLALAMNGWAMHWLVWKLTGQRRAALLAGVVFLAYPAMQGQLAAGHVGLLALWPAPLYSYALFRLGETADRRWMGFGALFFVLGLLGSPLLLLFVLSPLTILFLIKLLVERNWAGLRRVVMAVVVGGALSLIFTLPGVFETLSAPARLREGGEVEFSADLLTIVTPSFQHPLLGGLNYTHRILGRDPFEKPGYVGILAGLLAAIAAWRRGPARWWLLLAAVAWVLSLGPLLKMLGEPVRVTAGEYESYVPLPWTALQNLPVANIARTPARFNLTVGLAVAVMAGYGAAYLSRYPLSWRVGAWRAMPLLHWTICLWAVFAVLWEYQLFWSETEFGTVPGIPTIPGLVPEPIAALSQRGDVRAVFDIPWQHLLTDKEAMFLQTGHQRPLIAGHIARRTPVNPAKLWLLQSTLDPALLDSAGVDIIILHKDWDDDKGILEAFARGRLGELFYEDEHIAAFEAPSVEADPQFTTLLPYAESTNDQADFYLYAPESGWVTFSGEVTANGRAVALSLDDGLIHEWMVDSGTNVRVPLFVDAGYHTITLALQPACPEHYNPTLRCRALYMDDLALDDYTSAAPSPPVQLERGVQLAGSRIEREGDRLTISLWWRFEQPMTEFDARFVHVLDADGHLVVQDDVSLGERPAYSGWAEAVNISLPDGLPAGTYTVYTGWYTYPTVTRLAVLADTPGAQDGLIYLGTFEVQ